MSFSTGRNIKMTIFGQSHSDGLGVVLDGLPAGEPIDFGEICAFLQRRRGGGRYATGRVETDQPEILSGLIDGSITCGAPLCAIFHNGNVKKDDYKKSQATFRPSHADYTAFVKYGGHNDPSGGGHLSGRLTLPMCFAGAVCAQILARRGVNVSARVHSIGGFAIEKDINAAMAAAENDGDSVGGVIACEISGMPAGYGEPIFDSVEGVLGAVMFAIPGAKGVEFGAGFAIASMRGYDANDIFFPLDNGAVRTKTNHSGGVQGGITNGMPIVFRVAFKPTPSISKPQTTLNFATGRMEQLSINGRHDVCFVPRAVPCVEAMAACVMCDILLGGL